MKKIVFVTGTRADYSKMKIIISRLDNLDGFDVHVFVCGMHTMKKCGNTYKDILDDQHKNIHIAFETSQYTNMSDSLGGTILSFSEYVYKIQPDLIVVHGDRIEALAGAVVGCLNNVIVAHIEGGEISGTIDESLRHAITKLSHIHFVSNSEAKRRVIQIGEKEHSVYIVGSPDIDIMLDGRIPKVEDVKADYKITIDKYGILIYHPVTTEYDIIEYNVRQLLEALKDSGKNYIVILPNNDLGADLILNAYKQLANNPKFNIVSSVKFEQFLSILKNAEFIIGNSSAGIKEACVYGIPAIDVGTRQRGRYSVEKIKNIVHVDENRFKILDAIENVNKYRYVSSIFGSGDSSEKIVDILNRQEFWYVSIQKQFVDLKKLRDSFH